MWAEGCQTSHYHRSQGPFADGERRWSSHECYYARDMIGGARHGRRAGKKWVWVAPRCVRTPNARRRAKEDRNGGGDAFVGDGRYAKWNAVRR